MQSSIDLDKFRLPINSNIFTISYDSNDQPEAIHNNGQAPIEIKTSGVLSGLVCVDNTPYLTSQLIIGCVGDPGSYDVTNPEFIFVTDCLSNDSFLEISQIVGSTAVILIREIPQLERLENKHVDNLQQKLI
jgi:hypothetical protein